MATPKSESTFVIEAVHRIFRPIIRLLVGRVNCSFLLDVIRKIYIEEARRELRHQNKGKKVTKSALALMTGLDTRTIDRVDSAMGSDDQTSRAGYTSESAMMERWRSDPEYIDERGQPRVLPIEGHRGSFSSLVSSCLGRNITASMMLNNLSEAGNIEVIDGTSVRVLNPWYQAITSSERVLIENGSAALNRLAEVVEKNTRSAPENRLLQRERWTLRVQREDLPEIERQCIQATERNIVEIERILEKFEQPGFDWLTVGFGVGWYHWLTDTEEGEENPQ
ncbi:MAG: DUF6502 family protein [Wenzhouxiangellaceae bacterium]